MTVSSPTLYKAYKNDEMLDLIFMDENGQVNLLEKYDAKTNKIKERISLAGIEERTGNPILEGSYETFHDNGLPQIQATVTSIEKDEYHWAYYVGSFKLSDNEGNACIEGMLKDKLSVGLGNFMNPGNYIGLVICSGSDFSEKGTMNENGFWEGPYQREETVAKNMFGIGGRYKERFEGVQNGKGYFDGPFTRHYNDQLVEKGTIKYDPDKAEERLVGDYEEYNSNGCVKLKTTLVENPDFSLKRFLWPEERSGFNALPRKQFQGLVIRGTKSGKVKYSFADEYGRETSLAADICEKTENKLPTTEEVLAVMRGNHVVANGSAGAVSDKKYTI